MVGSILIQTRPKLKLLCSMVRSILRSCSVYLVELGKIHAWQKPTIYLDFSISNIKMKLTVYNVSCPHVHIEKSSNIPYGTAKTCTSRVTGLPSRVITSIQVQPFRTLCPSVHVHILHTNIGEAERPLYNPTHHETNLKPSSKSEHRK